MLTSGCTERLLGWRTGSDRREVKPTTLLAIMGRACDWLLAREFHRGPERNTLSISEAEDTTAVRSPIAIRYKITLAGGVQIRSWAATTIIDTRLFIIPRLLSLLLDPQLLPFLLG